MDAMQKPEGGRATVKVTVRYAAAKKPFTQDAAGTEPLSTLKQAVLDEFGLTEGASVEGGVASYKLYYGRDELTDLTRTVGDVTGHAAALELKLSQVLTQGMQPVGGRIITPTTAAR